MTKTRKTSIARLVEVRKRLRDVAAQQAAAAAEALERAEASRDGALQDHDDIHTAALVRLQEATDIRALWLFELDRHASEARLREAEDEARAAQLTSDREHVALRARARDLRVTEKAFDKMRAEALAGERRSEQRAVDDLAGGKKQPETGDRRPETGDRRPGDRR